jgi:hypothetical protein
LVEAIESVLKNKGAKFLEKNGICTIEVESSERFSKSECRRKRAGKRKPTFVTAQNRLYRFA